MIIPSLNFKGLSLEGLEAFSALKSTIDNRLKKKKITKFEAESLLKRELNGLKREERKKKKQEYQERKEHEVKLFQFLTEHNEWPPAVDSFGQDTVGTCNKNPQYTFF